MPSFDTHEINEDILKRDWKEKEVKERLKGTSWKHYGSARDGLASFKDDAIIQRHMKTEAENLGSDVIRFAAIGSDGEPVHNATMNWHGKIITADDQGVFKIVDEDIVNKRVKEEEERRKYIESIIEKASLTDDICRLILGVPDLEPIMGVNQKPQKLTKMTPELVAVDCKPSMLECYDPTSREYARAIAKFKQIIIFYWPTIEKMTPESVAKEGEI